MRIILRFVLLAVVAAFCAWFADRPGVLSVDWLGYRVEISLGVALLALLLLLVGLWIVWSLTRGLVRAPGSLFGYFRGRRGRRGQEALSKGLVAVAAGDAAGARRHSQITTRLLPDNPMTRLLEAQTAQLEGDQDRVRTVYESMAEEPETRLVALRGLFMQARHQHDDARARKIAEQAYGLNPGLGWASLAVLAARALDRDWPAVLSVLEAQRRAGMLAADLHRRKRAAVHAAQAITAEEHDAAAALDLAQKALKLDPGLVPAAVVAARVLIAQNALRRATRLIERTWALNPHPDLAELDAYARAGDSPQDRLKRIRNLLKASDGGEEGAVALARAAMDAHDWTLARQTLEPLIDERPRARICLLMAEIEENDAGDRGRTREWLARAARAPRDPAWIAGDYLSDTWLPVSPVTGEIGMFEWRTPREALGQAHLPPSLFPQARPPALPPAREAAEPVDVTPRAMKPEAPPAPVTEKPVEPASSAPMTAPAAAPAPRPAKAAMPAEPAKSALEKEELVMLQLRQPDDPGPESRSDEDDDPSWPRRLAGT
ncbi:MAG: heme biosynthesis protein HemY [Parvibaculaceae bacterium]